MRDFAVLLKEMIRDRLYELKQSVNDDECIEIDDNLHEDELHILLNNCLGVRHTIDSIKENIEKMKGLVNQQTFHYKDKGIRQQMESLISDSLSKSQSAHKSIKAFQEDLSKSPTCKTEIIFRIMNNQLSYLKHEYLNVYKEHMMFIEKYEDRLKKILKREAQIMSRSISIEETEELISSKEKTPSLFVENILEETQKAQLELREIVQRHNKLVELEKSLEEVCEMFVHISTYVMEQGALIQVIEYETEKARGNIDKGADELEKARELKIKSLKKKTWILIILLIVFGIIILLLIT